MSRGGRLSSVTGIGQAAGRIGTRAVASLPLSRLGCSLAVDLPHLGQGAGGQVLLCEERCGSAAAHQLQFRSLDGNEHHDSVRMSRGEPLRSLDSADARHPLVQDHHAQRDPECRLVIDDQYPDLAEVCILRDYSKVACDDSGTT